MDTAGFFAGGSLALWSATLSDDITATAGFYPGMPWSRLSPTWDRYQDKAAIVHCSEEDGTAQYRGGWQTILSTRSWCPSRAPCGP
jgi:carboxymethylenebutenolidase